MTLLALGWCLGVLTVVVVGAVGVLLTGDLWDEDSWQREVGGEEAT